MILFFITSVLAACKKKDPASCDDMVQENPLPPYTIQNNYKDYFVFQPGSWWVYEDTVLDQKDSVYVDSSSCEMKDKMHSICTDIVLCQHEACSTYIKSQVYPFDYFDQISVDEYGYHNAFRTVTSSNSSDHFFFGYPLHNNDEIQKIIELSSLTVNGMIYYDIFKIEYFYGKVYYQGPLPSVPYEIHYYFAKNIGLIKRDIIDYNQVWELVKFNVVQ